MIFIIAKEYLMLRYKEKELTKLDGNLGGKNQTKGFYRDQEGCIYFIKKPDDNKELFTELLAGLLLKEFKQRKLIPSQYFDSLIHADWIKFEDGSYGLIQPKVDFTELYKIIGTGFKDNSDRNPLIEMLSGPNYYTLLTSELKPYYGLSIALMFSMLFGDYSVHSGNVVCIKQVLESNNKTATQFARIDWGAAFRYFGYYEDILNPFEYQGWFNFKLYTKGYIFNYKKINGLFPAIAQRAQYFQAEINDNFIDNIVLCALKEIPKDLLSQSSQAILAKYLGIPSFAQIDFAKGENYQPFVIDFSKILINRLTRLCQLKDLTYERNFLYQSMIFVKPMNHEVKTNYLANVLESKDELNYKNLEDENQIKKLVERFSNELLNDPIFISILDEGHIVNIIPELINNLLKLKNFYNEKLAICKGSNNLDDSNSLEDFYKNSILIFLSNKDCAVKARNLLEITYKYFYTEECKSFLFKDALALLNDLFNNTVLIEKKHHKMNEKNRFFNFESPDFNSKYSASTNNFLCK
ncbi:hypothetical protein ACNVED_03010 [Legionella sp. D16C41]|uniref:hypothetical protein n=1 Tax=Legionella sp. D16C41 TaxID=3402688 RepID=UPI003AF69EDD